MKIVVNRIVAKTLIGKISNVKKLCSEIKTEITKHATKVSRMLDLDEFKSNVVFLMNPVPDITIKFKSLIEQAYPPINSFAKEPEKLLFRILYLLPIAWMTIEPGRMTEIFKDFLTHFAKYKLSETDHLYIDGKRTIQLDLFTQVSSALFNRLADSQSNSACFILLQHFFKILTSFDKAISLGDEYLIHRVSSLFDKMKGSGNALFKIMEAVSMISHAQKEGHLSGISVSEMA